MFYQNKAKQFLLTLANQLQNSYLQLENKSMTPFEYKKFEKEHICVSVYLRKHKISNRRMLDVGYVPTAPVPVTHRPVEILQPMKINSSFKCLKGMKNLTN